jgi:hypothetical protein
MISNMLGRTKYFRAPAVLCPSATGCRHLETALAFTPHELLVAFRTVHKCMLTPVKKKTHHNNTREYACNTFELRRERRKSTVSVTKFIKRRLDI